MTQEPASVTNLTASPVSTKMNYYDRYNINCDEALIFTMGAFRNSHPLSYHSGNPDVAAYKNLLEALRQLDGVSDVKDLNATDDNGHKKYIFSVHLDNMLSDNRVMNSVELTGRFHGFEKIKYLHPRGMNLEVGALT